MEKKGGKRGEKKWVWQKKGAFSRGLLSAPNGVTSFQAKDGGSIKQIVIGLGREDDWKRSF